MALNQIKAVTHSDSALFDQFRTNRVEVGVAKPVASPFTEALALHAQDELDSHIEVRNENLTRLTACNLDGQYTRLVHLNLSMNKIAALEGSL